VLKIKERLKPYSVLISNLGSLSFLQLSNYIFPLILLPYLVRIFGAEKYGLISFAIAFNTYFFTLCDYGFNLSGTRYISANRDNAEKLSEVFSVIIVVKFLLFILSLIILITVVFTFNRFSGEWKLYLVSSGFVLGNVLFPLWFFQGVERMKYITIIQVTIRAVFVISVFAFVLKESDYLLYMILFSSSQILAGLIGFLTVLLKFDVHFFFPKLKAIRFHINEGWNIFLSMISINVYTNSNTFILGLFAPDTVVGYFAAADKIRLTFQGIITILSQSVYPHMNNLLKNSFKDFSAFAKKLLSAEAVIGFAISLILFSLSYWLADIFLGTSFGESVLILKILSPLPFLIGLSNVFGIQIMLPLGFDKQFNIVLLFAAVIHLILLFILIPEFFAAGTSVAMNITEGFVTASMFIFVLRKTLVFKK
jgi:PST family polysaccharide transporter